MPTVEPFPAGGYRFIVHQGPVGVLAGFGSRGGAGSDDRTDPWEGDSELHPAHFGLPTTQPRSEQLEGGTTE